MDTMTNDQVIAGLDVGSSRVTTVLGRRTQDGVEILGMGGGPTDGRGKGGGGDVDDMAGIKDPRGMTGIRLDARVHVVTNDVPGARNLARCVEKADFDVESFVLSPLASAEAVLTPEEREVGVALMDFGGG